MARTLESPLCVLCVDKCLSQADGFPVNAYVECGDDNKVRFYSYETVESCEAGDMQLTDTISTNVCTIPEEGVSSWQWDCNVAADTPTIYSTRLCVLACPLVLCWRIYLFILFFPFICIL